MKAKVSWVNGLTFLGQSESGHAVVFDADRDSNTAPTPMEMLLMSAGACSSVDVVSILEKARQQVSACRVELSGVRAETVPKVFTELHLHFVVSGKALSEKHVERAVSLSAEKYCSVSIMLSQSVKVTHSFSVEDAE
ncbi:OsmC family protein [Alishewanella sp. 16-MA]|uniref:OsmC family protein n=1 Tax=Alishewanella maricola TaxID=2795740 RepID=A0ABS8C3Y7_9ALTE|nr:MULTISPECIES: OsmC family protein [Gammaproteobacteria]MDP4944564.1 OsmC family protein [Alishewanella sp.]MCB5227014.1 OsmC family protein [Alishewanella maricola]MCC5452566.1 OsmC family protein [Rheinheimera sp. UJ51]MCF4010133.1 OsmC family protein [Rheinheimera sp. UJ63]MDP5036196.1 OsmC family protein [Alishewanella sp.]